MPIIAKTPEKISEQLGDMGEFYVLPRTLNGYSDVTARNNENGMHYRAAAVNGDLQNWLRSTMQSLLEQAIEEMPEEERSCTDSYCKGCERSSAPDRNAMRSACIAAIKSLQERI